MKHVAIQMSDVTKEYTIHHEKPTLVEKFINRKTEKFIALNNLNLVVHKGEKVGIIGANGSGKTTILKIIAGITTPTGGTVRTYGKVISLIDLEAGFHDDLTGEQNIYLNGMLLGMKKEEIRSKLMRIIRFADIGQFIDAPLFTYSSGMKLRLGFAIAIHADPDILILDEGILAGDQQFQRKTVRRINTLITSQKTIIIVSHWLDFLEKTCKRIIMLDHGRIAGDDGTGILKKYKMKR